MRLKEPLPKLTSEVQWLNSNELSRSELIGEKPVLFYFWSVSCGTCTKGIHRVTEFFREYEDEVKIITVHLPRTVEDKKIDLVKEYMATYHLDYPVIIDQDHKLTNQFKNRYVPAFYLFDKNGRLRFIQAGKSTISLLNKRLERIVKEKA